MPTAEEKYLDRQVAHGIYINRYSSGLANRFEKELNEGINKALAEYIMSDPETKAAVLKTNNNINIIISEVYKNIKKKYNDEMRSFVNFEMSFQKKHTENIAGVELSLIPPKGVTSIIKSTPVGDYETISKWFKSSSESTYNNIASNINRGLDQGKSIDAIVKELRGTKKLGYKDGLLQTSKNNARAFVKTSVKAMETKTQTELWRENPDIVKRYEWVSVLDGRTSVICAERDGKTYKVGEGPLPPAHPNCRSSVTPVFNDKAKQSEKARYAISGKQAPGTTYRDFLARQPAAFQKQVLGARRYEAFKKDKNVIDKFVSPAGEIYSVKELEQKDVL
jgi:SPP1 gp7 family putative phage head morphogenesis protein